MAGQTLTDYELRRLENIRRNEEMMASLNMQRKATELSAAVKRSRAEVKGFKTTTVDKKPKSEAPVVIRRSLRTQGIPPVVGTEEPREPPGNCVPLKPPIDRSGPVSFLDARSGGSDDRSLVETILRMSENAPLRWHERDTRDLAADCLEVEEFMLKEENVARVVPGRILNVRFLPRADRMVAVAGDKLGSVGFWDADFEGDEGDGFYVYRPHSSPVSAISVQPFSMNKILTSSYDGDIRLMNVEKERFDLVYLGNEAIFSLTQKLNEVNCLYFSEGKGRFNIWDVRAGKVSSSFSLHTHRINTIDFSPVNPNLMATSSTDGLACTWDLRSMNRSDPKNLRTVEHEKAVHSAYFSPSGGILATTSADNTVGLTSGADFTETTMIPHYNKTNRWISSLRAIWGWTDTHLFMGNIIKRAVDVIFTNNKRTISLESSYMTAIPCRFAAHPLMIGTLAGTTAGGKVYIWTRR